MQQPALPQSLLTPARIKTAVTFLVAITCCLLNTAASAVTTVAGGTLFSAHWTLAGSPYKITGHIVVANNDSLVIDPGVTVEFQGKYKLFCNGKILANGTSSQPILFTVPAANQSTGWLGIRYDNTPTTNGRSLFQYCTIEYGKADILGDNSGGAFYFDNFSNCTISNCTLRNNYAFRGGCIAGTRSSPILKNCAFLNNLSSNGGHCIELWNSASIIDSCYFTGSGITTSASTLKITNCTFYKCIEQGGISAFADFNSGSGYLEISHNVFDSCTQINGGGGGAILLFNDQARIAHNVFRNNISEQAGGAVSCFTQSAYANTSTTIISNNLFYNNTSRVNPPAIASFGGGAIHFSNCSGNVFNNTIVNNTSDTVGGAIFCQNNASPSFYNNIIYDNSSKGNPDNIFILDNSSDPAFHHNNLQGGFAGINTNGTALMGANVNNIDSMPVFINPAAGNYALGAGSPGIDAGTSTGISGSIPLMDLAGNRRITGAAIDMGAYETAGVAAGLGRTNKSVSFYVVPNPASGYFEIKGASIGDIKAVRVSDMLGRQLVRFDNISSHHFDLGNVAAGVLLVSVSYKDGSEDVIRLLKN